MYRFHYHICLLLNEFLSDWCKNRYAWRLMSWLACVWISWESVKKWARNGRITAPMLREKILRGGGDKMLIWNTENHTVWWERLLINNHLKCVGIVFMCGCSKYLLCVKRFSLEVCQFSFAWHVNNFWREGDFNAWCYWWKLKIGAKRVWNAWCDWSNDKHAA